MKYLKNMKKELTIIIFVSIIFIAGLFCVKKIIPVIIFSSLGCDGQIAWFEWPQGGNLRTTGEDVRVWNLACYR
jgi:hypothetical protein